MSDPIDMVKLVKELPSRPRGRACVVMTHDFAGQKAWAEELARQTESYHIDLLSHFANDEALRGSISQFSVPRFFGHLKTLSENATLIVSGIEFLKATWSGQSNATEQFASLVETWNHPTCLLFVMQYDSTLARRSFDRFRQYTFVVDQKETFALT